MRRIGLIGVVFACLMTARCGDGEKPKGMVIPKPDWEHRPPQVAPVDAERIAPDPKTGILTARGEALVGLAEGATRESLTAELAKLPFRAEVVGEIPDYRIVQVRYQQDDDEVARKALDGLEASAFASPNDFYEPTREFDDPAFRDPEGKQAWGLDAIRVKEAWDTTIGDGVLVAVVDDGVDPDHPELRGRIAGTWSFKTNSERQSFETYPIRMVDGAGNPITLQGREGEHGTHVAGTIAAAAGNGQGTAGVAPGARILAYQVLYLKAVPGEPAPGRVVGSTSDITAGISRAVGAGAQVINMSLGPSFSPAVKEALQDPARREATLRQILELRREQTEGYARVMPAVTNRSVAVVVAAGNDAIPSNWTALPTLPETIGVGAVSRDGARADFSNFDDGSAPRAVDVCAPGVDIWSLRPGDAYQFMRGTSMASPHVAGLAALLKSVAPSATGPEIQDVLVRTGKRLTTDRDVGPQVDAAAAVAEMRKRREGTAPPPTVRPTPPPQGPRVPPGVRWTGQPTEIVVILDFGGVGNWLGQLIRFLIDLFFRTATAPEGGRYDEFGRYIRPPGIVSRGPPPDFDGRDRIRYLWEKRRDAVGTEGVTLEAYVVKEAVAAAPPTAEAAGPGTTERGSTSLETPDAEAVAEYVRRFDEILAKGIRAARDEEIPYLAGSDVWAKGGGVTLLGVSSDPESQTVEEGHLALIRAILAKYGDRLEAIQHGAATGQMPAPFPKSLEVWGAFYLLAHDYVASRVNGQGRAYELKARVLLDVLSKEPRVYGIVKGIYPIVEPSAKVAAKLREMGYAWAAGG